MIAAYVSGLNRCRYCHGVHAATAQRLTGVSASDMAAMVASDDFSSVDAAMRPVLALAGALTRDPRSVTPALADAVTPRRDGTRRPTTTSSRRRRCSTS